MMFRARRRWALGGILALACTPAALAGAADEPKPVRYEDEPAPFVPKTPRADRDQRRIDALRDFVAARALEERRRFAEAFGLLEKAQRNDPDSPAILRGLSRLAFAMSRNDQGIAFSKQAVEADPADALTLRQLVEYYTRKFEPAAAEAILKQALDNPKLDKGSPAAFVARRDLGALYAGALGQPEKAADAFAVVLDGLDAKAANKFTAGDLKLILGNDPEAAYQLFGDTFFLVRRYDLAVRAFRRGLAYNPDDTELPLRLAEALLRNGQKAEALATVEPELKDKPEAREPYELLSQILTALDRKAEVIPRLEAALKDDAKNVGLRYVLADRYKEAGKVEQANALYEGLAKGQDDREGFAALAQSLRKEKKYDELLKLFERAIGAPNGKDAILPTIEAVCLDKEATAAILDVGIRMATSEPPTLGRSGQQVLVYMATRAELPEKLIPLERFALKQAPNPMGYKQLWQALSLAGNYDEAVETLEEMLQKFPEEGGDSRTLLMLCQSRLRAGKIDPALEAARKALQLNPGDANAMSLAGLALTKLARYDEAIAQYKAMLDRFADNEDAVRQARSGLSNAYVESGDLDRGEAELEVLFQKSPDDPGVNNDLGYLYADRGKNLEKAEAMVRKALEESPDQGAYLDSLGWVLYRRGKIKEAVEPLERACKLEPGDATIFDHLGDVYFRLQEHAKARTAWEKAEAIMGKSAPPDKRVGDVRRKLEALKQQPAPPNPSNNNP